MIGRLATPTIIIGDQVLLGFAASRAKIEELLEKPVIETSAAPRLTESPEERARREAMDKVAKQILQQSKTIAVVGLSPDPARPSNEVARYLQAQGYRVIPVNPMVPQILGERSYPDLASVPDKVDVVDIFRSPEHVGPIVEAAIAKKIPAVWMQEGVINEAAAERARAAGMLVVTDRCMRKEHSRLKSEGEL